MTQSHDYTVKNLTRPVVQCHRVMHLPQPPGAVVVGWRHISCRDWSLVEATCTLAFEGFFLKQKIFANDTLPKTWDFEWCETFIDQESVIHSCFDLILVLIWHCYTLKYCCWTLSNWCQNMFDLIVALCFNSLIWKCPKHRPRSFLPCLLGVCHASLAIQPAAVCSDAPVSMLAFNTALYMSYFFFGSEPWPSNLDSPHVYLFSWFRNFRAFHSAAHSGTFYKGWCFSAGHGSVTSGPVKLSMKEMVHSKFTGWWFHFFWFSPLGKRSNLTNIFQMGWTHQQVYILGGIVVWMWKISTKLMSEILDHDAPTNWWLPLDCRCDTKSWGSFFSVQTCLWFCCFFQSKDTNLPLFKNDFPHFHQKTSNNIFPTSEFPWGNLWVFPKIVVPPNHPF